ncbi:hypothetical protein K435DRAFT_878995 [Dendrothele bispora CBS 962.96]|uniref:Uncharacterized protein n=1 Tax=Dendrothele bispora (strain CBS 962.96) TaxID=1314807 RepID=A0A4S8KLW4_DENBC|nr:hypothetical protein K435DRAFT_878995 [Dendrothele bispora CBS 962.96]
MPTTLSAIILAAVRGEEEAACVVSRHCRRAKFKTKQPKDARCHATAGTGSPARARRLSPTEPRMIDISSNRLSSSNISILSTLSYWATLLPSTVVFAVKACKAAQTFFLLPDLVILSGHNTNSTPNSTS